jgi:hypothetical protein
MHPLTKIIEPFGGEPYWVLVSRSTQAPRPQHGLPSFNVDHSEVVSLVTVQRENLMEHKLGSWCRSERNLFDGSPCEAMKGGL